MRISLSVSFLKFLLLILAYVWGLILGEGVLETLILKNSQKYYLVGTHRVLSFARRMSLINSFLSSLPLFYLSFFKMSSIVRKKIVSIQRWVVRRGEKESGLGELGKYLQIKVGKEVGYKKNVELFNKALLVKWKWDLFKENNGCFWSEALKS